MRPLDTVDRTPCCYLTPKQDDFNKIPELQVCIAKALYDVDSIVADPGAYTKEQLATLHSQIVSNLEWAWEANWWESGSAHRYGDADLTGGSTTVQQTRMRAWNILKCPS